MSLALRSCAVLMAAATAASTADPDGAELLQKVQTKVLDDVGHLPRYTCVQTIERAQYRPFYGNKPEGCRALIAARKQLPSPGYPVWRDRLRLDVAVVDGAETFSWAGARRFETSRLDELVASGSAGNGEFASFLASVFGGAPDAFSFESPSLFRFTVPLENSRYTYHSRGAAPRITGYRGSFRVNPETAELSRLTITADGFPADQATCSVEDAMDYRRVQIGKGDFLLPSIATMDVLYSRGDEDVNQTRYSNCREYTGESTIRFENDAAPAGTITPKPAAPQQSRRGPLPPGLHFRIALTSTVHSETAAAGDPVTGVVLAEVRDPALGLIARPNDIVHGRIIQLEQYVFPVSYWLVALRFDTLEHDGFEQPITLKSLAGSPFTFRQSGNLTLDQTFQSDWETR